MLCPAHPFPNGYKKRRGSLTLAHPAFRPSLPFNQDKQRSQPTSGMIYSNLHARKTAQMTDTSSPVDVSVAVSSDWKSKLRSLNAEDKRQVTSSVCYKQTNQSVFQHFTVKANDRKQTGNLLITSKLRFFLICRCSFQNLSQHRMIILQKGSRILIKNRIAVEYKRL